MACIPQERFDALQERFDALFPGQQDYEREGIELSISTMADHVGACAAALRPIYELIKTHVFAGQRIHGDDTTVPVLAKVKSK
jgi:transposase